MDSVVLPAETKELILTDMDNFLAEETAEWYAKHGICYKRSYLLYGPPGTGKTSFLSAIASKYDKALCFLQAGHPLLTDSSLQQALSQLPEDSVVVMEDIDSLFTVDRKTDNKSPLTFSGLLNSLDGLASPQGSLIFMTSNFPERLDNAMLRHGRVDVRVEFPAATEAQVAGLFRTFYPQADVEAAVAFSQALKKEWGSMNLAALQDFFIQNRLRTWDVALKHVEPWLKQQEEAQEAIKEFEKKNAAKAAQKDDAIGGDGDGDGEGLPRGRQAVAEAPAGGADDGGRRRKGGKRRGGRDSILTSNAVYFGVAVAAIYFLLKKTHAHE
jgi:ATP-dependent 26S proteasome regulatory subunit